MNIKKKRKKIMKKNRNENDGLYSISVTKDFIYENYIMLAPKGVTFSPKNYFLTTTKKSKVSTFNTPPIKKIN